MIAFWLDCLHKATDTTSTNRTGGTWWCFCVWILSFYDKTGSPSTLHSSLCHLLTKLFDRDRNHPSHQQSEGALKWLCEMWLDAQHTSGMGGTSAGFDSNYTQTNNLADTAKWWWPMFMGALGVSVVVMPAITAESFFLTRNTSSAATKIARMFLHQNGDVIRMTLQKYLVILEQGTLGRCAECKLNTCSAACSK